MAAIYLSRGFFSREPICPFEEKTKVERMVEDSLANGYQHLSGICSVLRSVLHRHQWDRKSS
ncbi:ZNF561 isoform 10 [Pan troglodytes]|uniref:ZNF561 isoform 10 n=1 Tax=Pan troglodytes TaxID=9598 RepID=A0A2J8LWU9_PANTR|nr:ZNF561 isoform 10 [Pan troglodytes]